MAEATLTPVVEETPLNDVAPLEPDSTTESAPPAETPPEDTSAVDAFLQAVEKGVTGTVANDGKAGTSDGVVPSTEVAQTPAQIREDERKKVAAELQQREVQNQAQNYIDGLTRTVTEDAPAKLEALADRWGMDADSKAELRNEINRIKGAFKPLLDRAIDVDKAIPQVKSAAYNEAAAFTLDQLTATARTELGESAYKTLVESKHESWADVAGSLIKEARKGYVPASDYLSRSSVRENSDKLEQALKQRGAAGIVTSSLKELMGSTGPDTPAATGGAGGRLTKARFEAMSIEDQMKVSSEDVARVYGAIR